MEQCSASMAGSSEFTGRCPWYDGNRITSGGVDIVIVDKLFAGQDDGHDATVITTIAS